MKLLWQLCGRLAFWLSWPGSWLYLRIGSRTRVLVVAEGAVLVVKPWLGAGKWILPGGGLHRGEEVVRGALRELREETGLVLESSQLTPLHQAIFSQYGFRFPYSCFVVEVPARPPTRRQLLELTDLAWLPLESVTPATCQTDITQALSAWRERTNLVH